MPVFLFADTIRGLRITSTQGMRMTYSYFS